MSLFHLLRHEYFYLCYFCDPTTLHFKLLSSSSSLSYISYSHLLSFSAEPSFFWYPAARYITIFSSYRFRTWLNILSSSDQPPAFSVSFPVFTTVLFPSSISTFLFLQIDSPIPPPILSFLRSLFLLFTYHVLLLTLLCMHLNFYLLLPFLLLLLIIIVLDLFSSHHNTPSYYYYFFYSCSVFSIVASLQAERFLLFFAGYSYLLQFLSPADISGLTKQNPKHGLYPLVLKCRFNPALVPWGLCDPSPLWLAFFF